MHALIANDKFPARLSIKVGHKQKPKPPKPCELFQMNHECSGYCLFSGWMKPFSYWRAMYLLVEKKNYLIKKFPKLVAGGVCVSIYLWQQKHMFHCYHYFLNFFYSENKLFISSIIFRKNERTKGIRKLIIIRTLWNLKLCHCTLQDQFSPGFTSYFLLSYWSHAFGNYV